MLRLSNAPAAGGADFFFFFFCFVSAEGVLLEKDVHGAGAIAELHSRYFDRWRYTHKEIAQ
jgi:hypothetical protein